MSKREKQILVAVAVVLVAVIAAVFILANIQQSGVQAGNDAHDLIATSNAGFDATATALKARG